MVSNLLKHLRGSIHLQKFYLCRINGANLQALYMIPGICTTSIRVVWVPALDRFVTYQRHPTTAAASFVQAEAKITTSQRPFGSWDNEIDDAKLGLSFVRLAKCRQCPSTFLDPYGRSVMDVMGLLPRLQ